MRSDFCRGLWNCFPSRLQSSGPSDGRARAPVSRSAYARYIRRQGPSTLEPGIRGALEVHVHHESVFGLDDIVRCADVQNLPGCPVTVLTLNGRARPVPRPHEVEPQCYCAHAKVKQCRAGARWLPCRGVAIYYCCRPSLFRELHGDIDRHKVLCRTAGRKSSQDGIHHISCAG